MNKGLNAVSNRIDELRGKHQSLRDDVTALYRDNVVPLEKKTSRLERRVEELENE